MAIESDKARENYQHYCYARDNGHLDYVSKAKRCTEFVVGRQWDKAVEQALKAVHKPMVTVNKVLSTLATIEGEQIQSQFDIGFRPLRNGAQFETADALNAVWLSISAANHLPWQIIDVFDMGARTSRGFFDVRLSFDDNWLGEAQISVLNGKNVVVDPDAEHIDPDTWNEVFISKWMTPDNIESTYGLLGVGKELRGREKSVYADGYDSMDDMSTSFGGLPSNGHYDASEDKRRRRTVRVIERQYRETKTRPHFVNPTTGDIREVPADWDRERVGRYMEVSDVVVVPRKTSVIHWLTTSEEFVLHDKVSPLKHFTPVPFFPFFFDGDTVGLVENSLSPQELLNKATSQELHVVNTTANSGWQMEEGQLVNMTAQELERKGATTGLVLVRQAGSKPLEKINPNQVPTGLDRVGFKAEGYLKETMNVSDSQRGFDRADVAAKAIEAKRSAGSVNMTKPFGNLLRTVSMVARNVVDIVQAYYTEERLLFVTGGVSGDADAVREVVVNQTTPEGRVANDLTVGEYEVVTTLVPPRDALDDTVFEEAKSMRLELGIAIPDEFMIEASRLPRKGQLLRAMREQAAADANANAQELAALELEKAKLGIAEQQAKVMLAKANAALAVMRAKHTGVETAAGPEQENQQRALEEMAIAREKVMGELQLAREKLQGELDLARDKARGELQIKRAAAAATAQIAAENAETQQQVALDNAAVQQEVTKKNAAAQAASKKTVASAAPKKPAKGKRR